MIWAILLIGFLLAFAKSKAFRKGSLIIAGLLILLLLAALDWNHLQEEHSKTLVTADQLTFTDLRLGPESYGSSYHLTGRVKNNSGYEVFGIDCRFHLLDCESMNDCSTIGDGSDDILTGVLPPKQVRDIDATIYLGYTKPRQRFAWNYSVKEIRARVASQ